MTSSFDAAVARYVKTRHRVIALAEVKALGLTKRPVERRLETEEWTTLHRGVYLVGGGEPTPWARCRAAALAIGADAWVTHRSATALWHLHDLADGPVHVTTTRKLPAREGIVVHWTRHPPMRKVRHGVPTTTLGRALADAAEISPAAQMEPLLRSARRLHGLDRRAVPVIPGRRGRGRVAGGAFARGRLIERFIALCAEEGFEAPETEYELLGYEIDAAWPAHRIAVEVDDYDTHENRDAMDADRERDRRLLAHGWKPVRVTHAHLTAGRRRLVAHLRALQQ
jgi:hypothetical protein